MQDLSSELCLSCGACCDGTIFSRVPVEESDGMDYLMSVGIPIVKKEDLTFFEPPCVCLHQKMCQIYVNRPKVCRGFKCNVLTGYESQQISFQEAQRRVNHLFSIKTSIREELEKVAPTLVDCPRNELGHRLNALSKEEGEGRAFNPKYARVLMHLMALNLFIERYFFRADQSTNSQSNILK